MIELCLQEHNIQNIIYMSVKLKQYKRKLIKLKKENKIYKENQYFYINNILLRKKINKNM